MFCIHNIGTILSHMIWSESAKAEFNGSNSPYLPTPYVPLETHIVELVATSCATALFSASNPSLTPNLLPKRTAVFSPINMSLGIHYINDLTRHQF